MLAAIFDRRGVTPEKLGSRFLGHGHRVISAKHLKGGRVDLGAGDDRFVDDVTHARWMKSALQPGDVLVTSEAPVGEVAFIGEHLEWCLGQRLFGLRPDATRLDGRFLFFALRTADVRSDLLGRATGTVAQGIRQPELLATRVPLPPLREQRAIARILGALDDKIELNRRTNETLEAMARALFQSWFVDFDPVRAKMEGRQPEGMDAETANLFPSEFGPDGAPRGWVRRALGSLITLQRGTTYSGALVGHPGPALLGLGSIVEGGGFREGRYKTYGGECPANLMLSPGDLYVALKGATKDGSMVGSVACVPPSVASGRLTQDTVKLVLIAPRQGLSRWLYRALLTPEYRTYCANRVTGSAQAALSREDFLAYSVPMPADGLLDRYGAVETRWTARRHAFEAESRSLTALRDTLLPKLLSGELRVPDAERAVSEVL
jgi:type I restriction enzyme S subunit